MSISIIDIDKIKPFLDRRRSKEDFARLVDSIKKYGVLNPIRVTAIKPEKKSGKHKKEGGKWEYKSIWGHGRIRAAREAGLKTIPAIIVSESEGDRVKDFFVENEVRKKLSTFELASLMVDDRKTMDPTSIAAKYALSQNTVRGYLNVMDNCTEDVISGIRSGELTFADAEAIAVLKPQEQRAVLKEVFTKKLKEHEIRDTIRAIHGSSGVVTMKALDEKSKALAKELREKTVEYARVYRRYTMSVVPLRNALKNQELRKALAKERIDTSDFSPIPTGDESHE